MGRKIFDFAWVSGRKLVVAVVGTTVILLGVALIVLPGPAIVVIPLGLGILGLEFAWARKVLRGLNDGSRAAVDRLRRRDASKARPAQQPSGDPGEGEDDGERPGADCAALARAMD
jgi:hypothetical protein